jgi:hypothetical protein
MPCIYQKLLQQVKRVLLTGYSLLRHIVFGFRIYVDKNPKNVVQNIDILLQRIIFVP